MTTATERSLALIQQARQNEAVATARQQSPAVDGYYSATDYPELFPGQTGVVVPSAKRRASRPVDATAYDKPVRIVATDPKTRTRSVEEFSVKEYRQQLGLDSRVGGIKEAVMTGPGYEDDLAAVFSSSPPAVSPVPAATPSTTGASARASFAKLAGAQAKAPTPPPPRKQRWRLTINGMTLPIRLVSLVEEEAFVVLVGEPDDLPRIGMQPSGAHAQLSAEESPDLVYVVAPTDIAYNFQGQRHVLWLRVNGDEHGQNG